MQGFSFIVVSGVGWVIDFSVFLFLSTILAVDIFFSNIISAIPAISFVFFVSTKRVFQAKTSRINKKNKLLIYITYQLILLISISSFGQLIYNVLLESTIHLPLFVIDHTELLIKVFITPISMGLNFLVMKLLIEKL